MNIQMVKINCLCEHDNASQEASWLDNGKQHTIIKPSKEKHFIIAAKNTLWQEYEKIKMHNGGKTWQHSSFENGTSIASLSHASISACHVFSPSFFLVPLSLFCLPFILLHVFFFLLIPSLLVLSLPSSPHPTGLTPWLCLH